MQGDTKAKATNTHVNSMETIAQKAKSTEVKCLCVHGICNKGESTCAKCDFGWTGRLCDTPRTQNRMVDVEDEFDSQVFKVKQI